ncbi:MAG: hypothetical protein KME27_29675 [Lyngbya sp. HA4199-MV5]|nr:hypothetical protein [Lyngbya sp. HA4199-MV5]
MSGIAGAGGAIDSGHIFYCSASTENSANFMEDLHNRRSVQTLGECKP